MRLILHCLFVCSTVVVILATENNTKEPTPATNNEKLTAKADKANANISDVIKADANKLNADEINADKNANKDHASKSRRDVQKHSQNQHSVPSPQKFLGQPPKTQPPSILRVKCFDCYDCPKAFLENTTYRQCPYIPDPDKQSTCLTYTEYNVRKPGTKFVVRSCASETGSCKELKASRENAPFMKIASCHECQGDFCNSTSKSLPGMFLGILMLMTTSLVKKHIAS